MGLRRRMSFERNRKLNSIRIITVVVLFLANIVIVASLVTGLMGFW